MLSSCLFDETYHSGNPCRHIVSHAESEREEEHYFRIRRTTDARVKLRRDGKHQVAFDLREVAN